MTVLAEDQGEKAFIRPTAASMQALAMSEITSTLGCGRSPPREPISLYISGLAAKVIDEDLYDHFEKEGKVRCFRAVVVVCLAALLKNSPCL